LVPIVEGRTVFPIGLDFGEPERDSRFALREWDFCWLPEVGIDVGMA
jgi:hypothetical protein